MFEFAGFGLKPSPEVNFKKWLVFPNFVRVKKEFGDSVLTSEVEAQRITPRIVFFYLGIRFQNLGSLR